MNLLLAFSAQDFCTDQGVGQILSLIGTVLVVFKWAIPIMLIVFGSFKLGQAVVAQKDDEVKKQYTSLIQRAIAAIIIFFIPSIVGLLVGAVNGGDQGSMSQCTDKLGLTNYNPR